MPGFERATLLEAHRRGLEHATQVAAVTDGAEWLPGFLAYHRADAVHILDFAHAAEYIHAIGEAVRAAGYHLPPCWLAGVLHRLKHEGPHWLLIHLQHLCQRGHDAEVDKKWQYLSARQSQMQYPAYQAAGWPIGSGMVESANKLVGEARLKGAGMHWKREHVNPMLLLRKGVCNDRWDETWQRRRKQARKRRQQKREQARQFRLEQATLRLLRLVLPFALRQSRPQNGEAPLSSRSTSPKGRTQAQDRWGRRPVSPRGALLNAGFAKK